MYHSYLTNILYKLNFYNVSVIIVVIKSPRSFGQYIKLFPLTIYIIEVYNLDI